MLCFMTVSVWVTTTLLSLHLGDCAEIFGGDEVVPHSLPYIALLEDKKGPCCGGTLINLQWVLTAAHCKRIKKVLLGVHNINKKEKEKKFRQVFNVTKSVRHPKRVNDLQLLKLDKPVKLTKYVKIHALPSFGLNVPNGTKCMVAGWGSTQSNGGDMFNTLRSVNVNVIDMKTCQGYYKPKITDGMLCTLGPVGRNTLGFCSGDSGGPLECERALAGVVSFGGEHCGGIEPGVHTFVPKVLDWITNIIKN